MTDREIFEKETGETCPIPSRSENHIDALINTALYWQSYALWFEKRSEWVSVKDRLPDEGLMVDVYGDDIVTVAIYKENRKSSYCCGFWDELNTDADGNQTDMQNVLFWRYRPTPPDEAKRIKP